MCKDIIIHSSNGVVNVCETVKDLWDCLGKERVFFEDPAFDSVATGEECLCTVDIARTAVANNMRVSSLNSDGSEDPFNVHFYQICEEVKTEEHPVGFDCIPTAHLVELLKKREGVECVATAPYNRITLHVEEQTDNGEVDEHIYRRSGPMVVLMIDD